jgi:DNA-binding transcriptional LysR family regulator
LNIRQIEAFQAVMSAGSVTRAGERLSISQPAVSQLIAQFERHCGFKLFERQGSKILPTREAEVLYGEVQRMFVRVAQIDRVASALREQSWGAMCVAGFPAITRRMIPDMICKFTEGRPDAHFRVESLRSRIVIDAVATQHADIGFSVIPGDRSEVESTLLHRLPAYCILHKRHPLAGRETIHAKDLANEPFVSLGPQDSSRNKIDRIFDDLQIPRRLRIEAGESETTFSFVAAEMGVAVVDPISVYNNQYDEVVVRKFVPAVEFDIWLIRPKARRPLNMTEAFVKHALDYLANYSVA